MITEGQDAEVRNEFWNTLVDQLRLRLSSMEASGKLEGAGLNEPLRNELTMYAKDAFLSVWVNTDTGAGSWNAITERLNMAEPWSMAADGSCEIGGHAMTLEAAMECFAAKLVNG